MHKCPKCGTEFDGNFCPECGEKYAEEKTCPKCGATLPGNVKFCNSCGYSFYESPAPTAPQPAKKERPLAAGTTKLYAAVSVLPAVLFALFSILLFLFFLAPVAVTPGGEFFGEKIPSESYGNVYEFSNYAGTALTGSLTALIALAACALFITLALAVTCTFSNLYYKRFTVAGKQIFLRSILTGIGYVLFFALFLVSCILMGQIPNEDGGLGLITAGAAPVLVLVFTLLGCLLAVGCAFMGAHLRKNYPELAAATEEKVSAAKPTAAATWLKNHKKLAVALSAVLVVAIAVGVAVPVGLANRYNGIYYAYNGETEKYDTTRYYRLTGSAWEDASGRKGTISFEEGEAVTLTYDPTGGMAAGSSAVKSEGTLTGDVLKIGGTVYAKEGHTHDMKDRECACGIKDNSSEGLAFEEEGDHWVVTGIGTCKDTNIVISAWHENKRVTSIGGGAFDRCGGLKSVTIPDSVTSIGYEAFEDCSGLTAVHITDLAAWCAIKFGSETSNPLSYAHHLYMDGEEVTELTISADVTEVKAYAFYNCSGLTSITIPDGVTTIGNSAFYNCSGLTGELKIPDSVTTIGNSAFYNCSGLTSVTIPDGVTSIGRYAFRYCSGLTSVTIPDSVTSIGDYAFSGCSELTSITIPDSVTSIGDYAFAYCSGLTSVTIPDSVTSIGSYAFWDCSGLKRVYIHDLAAWCAIEFYHGPSNPLYYAHHLYMDEEEVTELKIPDGVTSIGYEAFEGCSGLTSVVIPDSVTSIGDRAFWGCSGLTSVTIGSGVTSIGNYAFSGCRKLTDIQFKGTVAEWRAIQKIDGWDRNTPNYNVTCTNGTLGK